MARNIAAAAERLERGEPLTRAGGRA